MAKKKDKPKGDEPIARDSDPKTLQKLRDLGRGVMTQVQIKADPQLTLPSRTLSNAQYNRTKRIIEMGGNRQSRELFNLNQAKSYMQTLLIASGIKDLIESGKNASLRSVFYMSKHDIEGTSETTFEDQDESDPILEDLEVMTESLREELHIFAKSGGSLAGPITITDRGRDFNCMEMPSSGYGIPSIVEPDVIQFKQNKAKFVLHLEKDTVWQRFYEDNFHEKYDCIISHGGGQPPRGVRRILYRLHNELKLPVFCLLDNDPWGHYIYSVIKQGSINLAFESQRMAVPDAKFVGIRSRDYEEFELNKNVQIKMKDVDYKRAEQILNYPWFKGKKAWEREIEAMKKHGFKMEVEALTNKSLTFVTDEYVPLKLEKQDFLD